MVLTLNEPNDHFRRDLRLRIRPLGFEWPFLGDRPRNPRLIGLCYPDDMGPIRSDPQSSATFARLAQDHLAAGILYSAQHSLSDLSSPSRATSGRTECLRGAADFSPDRGIRLEGAILSPLR